jgi:hypothetical protein
MKSKDGWMKRVFMKQRNYSQRKYELNSTRLNSTQELREVSAACASNHIHLEYEAQHYFEFTYPTSKPIRLRKRTIEAESSAHLTFSLQPCYCLYAICWDEAELIASQQFQLPNNNKANVDDFKSHHKETISTHAKEAPTLFSSRLR